MGGKFSTGERAASEGGAGASAANGHAVAAERVDGPPGQGLRSQYRPVSQQLAIVPTVSVVIPAKNEARNLPMVLGSLPEWVDEVVLVDGHSVDETIAVARQCRPDIKIVTQPGKGKGDALLAGFKACTSDIVVMMDGDGSTPGTEIVRFVSALVAGADYAKGSRFANSGGSDDITVGRRLGNRIFSGLVNLAFGTRYTDLCYGYNAFWSEHLPALDLDCGGFEIETVMNIRAAKAALRVQEIPSRERPRVHGESNLHVVFDGWRILKAITAEASPRSHRSLPRRICTHRRSARRWPRRRPSSTRRRTPWRWSGRPNPTSGLSERRARSGRPLENLPTPAAARSASSPAGHDLRRDLRLCAATLGRDLRRGGLGPGSRAFRTKRSSWWSTTTRALYASLAAALPGVTVVENAEQQGLSGGRTPGSPQPRAMLSPFSTTTPSPTTTGSSSSPTPTKIPAVDRRRRTHPAVDWKVPRPAWFPERVRLGGGLHLPWHGRVARRRSATSSVGTPRSVGRRLNWSADSRTVSGAPRPSGPSAARRPSSASGSINSCPGRCCLFDERAMIWHLVPPDRSPLLLLPIPLLRRGPLQGPGHRQRRHPRRACRPSGDTPRGRCPWASCTGSPTPCTGDASGLERRERSPPA